MLTRRQGLLAAAAAGTGIAGPARLVVQGGLLRLDGVQVRCAVGRGGVQAEKREGDGATPAGVFPLREVLFRADRGAAPSCGLPVSRIGPGDGWSDDPADPAYNRRQPMAGPFHRETLWRADGLYDALVVIGANDSPAVAGRGSAIFLHVARGDFGPTDGCVAVARRELVRVLARCGPGSEIAISA